MFRSTGSYEPDLDIPQGGTADTSFDPQALTSLTTILPPLSIIFEGFDPQALTSLTIGKLFPINI